jgi:hypothetical protein
MLEKKCWEKMLEQFSTAIPTFSTFHKNVERILKKRKNIVQHLMLTKIVDETNIFKNVGRRLQKNVERSL